MTNDIPPEYPLISDAELQALADELPGLAMVRRFARATERSAWFAHLGEPLNTKAAQAARAYLDALGFPEVEVVLVRDWDAAEDAAESLDWDSPAWEAEEQLRAALASQALEHLSEEALQIALTHVTSVAHEFIDSAAQEAAAIWDVEEETLVALAAGSALQACHQAALVLGASAESDHPFALKYKLFEFGHWPISITGTTFNLF